MELFVINTYLSLLIFNPLEAAVLFLAATGDFKLVFSRKFIKHWFVLGTINFVFQYTVDFISIGLVHLFYSYFISIFIMGIILLYYNKIINIKIKSINNFYSSTFNLITILLGILLSSKFTGFFSIPQDASIQREIFVNLTIKIIQFLLLYMYYGGFNYEKYCKKYFKK